MLKATYKECKTEYKAFKKRVLAMSVIAVGCAYVLGQTGVVSILLATEMAGPFIGVIACYGIDLFLMPWMRKKGAITD